MTSRRGIRRLCWAGSGLFAVLAVVPTSGTAHAAPATTLTQLPTSFAGIAYAAGIFQTADRRTGVSATYQTIYGRLPDGFSEYGSEVLQARASVYFPGDAVVGLGTLLCVAAGPGTPGFCNVPKYPLYAQASGSTPDASVASPAPSSGVGPIGVGAATADAHADALKGVLTNGVMSNYDTPAGSGSLVHVGSIEAHTVQSFDSKAVLTDHAYAKLSGIDIAGGLVHIDSIFVESTRQVDGRLLHSVAEDFQVNGVTAAGFPATIGPNGISIPGSGPANTALQTALAGSGVTIRTLGHTSNSYLDDRGCGLGEEDGVQVSGQEAVNIPSNTPPVLLQPVAPAVPVPGLGPVAPSAGQVADTYFVKMVLGGACTDASAAVAPASTDQSGPVVTTPTVAPVGTTPSSTGSVSSPPFTGQTTSPGAIGNSPTPTQIASSPSRGNGETTVGFFQPILRGQMLRSFYLALALLLALFAIGARSFLPARLPSGR
jgi:hypothetical protein